MVGNSTADAKTSTIKFLCSYGGKIILRQPDAKLRYLGGHTRVVAVHRSIPFSELLVKLGELCGTTVAVRCQLPTEDLDALVSITCDEDLSNIIEEYDGLSSPPSPLKIRAFLSPLKPLKKHTASNATLPSFHSPRPFSSASTKSPSSSTSSSSSSPALSAASALAVASCSPRWSLMPMEGNYSIRHKFLPPLSSPMLEKSKGKISNHHPVPHLKCCYHGQRHVNTVQYHLIHNGNHWQ